MTSRPLPSRLRARSFSGDYETDDGVDALVNVLETIEQAAESSHAFLRKKQQEEDFRERVERYEIVLWAKAYQQIVDRKEETGLGMFVGKDIYGEPVYIDSRGKMYKICDRRKMDFLGSSILLLAICSLSAVLLFSQFWWLTAFVAVLALYVLLYSDRFNSFLDRLALRERTNAYDNTEHLNLMVSRIKNSIGDDDVYYRLCVSISRSAQQLTTETP